jgi:DNA-binding protein H-NS
MPDITHLSVEELKRLQAEAESLIASKKDQEIEDAYQQILAVAEKVGMTVEQLLEFGASKRKSVEPRYRSKSNPDDTWTGRGKQPRWLVAELEKGAKLDDFLI